MDLDHAAQRATAFLREQTGPEDGDRLVITRAELRDNGWLFFYTSAAFLRSRSFVDALGGNLPVLVRPDGTATAVPYEDIIDRAGQTFDPGMGAE